MANSLSRTFIESLIKADDCARELGQEFVGAEHLLLGILASDGEAMRILKSEADPAALERELRRLLPKKDDQPLITGRLPLSPKAQAIFNAAVADANQTGRSAVTTRHLLLALLADKSESITSAMSTSGADVNELSRLLKQPGAKREA